MTNCTWTKGKRRVIKDNIILRYCGGGGGRACVVQYHLEHGQVFLPPQVFLHLRPDGGQHVVRVHDDMYERVEQTEERAVAA